MQYEEERIFVLRVDNQNEQNICLLCGEICQYTDNIQVFTKSYWEKLKSLAKEWSTQCIEKHVTKKHFGKAHSFLIKPARFYHYAKGGWRPT